MKAAPNQSLRNESSHIDDEACRIFQRSAELAGKKWNAAILLALARGADRFSDIAHSVDRISDRLLAARLRELEQRRLIVREVIPTTPVQIRYRLSTAGEELIRILHPLVQWAERWEPRLKD
ncbi:transcriptional regulator [Arthrobacter crusticola]|uniref:Transcriptional regulator n=1 Tax=Arthrobacter crusticola TaxID=2547960 RepID=A0A4V3AM15_9MICC|nr:helix-turn-helix domain-containing protein [Arthrobacter crusticola]TDK25209.1 transcriptional regulator [Arthrobacter crusticola]